MADNYLEKKYEELRQGRPVMRRSSPSLDTLLHRLAGSDTPVDSGYLVKQAQLDAIVRSVGLIGADFSFETAETSPDSQAFVRIISPDGQFCLGQAVLAARLKASELSLSTTVSIDSPRAATVYVSR